MKPRKIVDRVYALGAIDWDRRLFDALIPLPDGTSYNAYLVEGSEKVVLVDSADPAMAEIFLKQLENVSKIDYIIAHHGEQDHSGMIPVVMERYPRATVLATPKGKEILVDHLHIQPERISTVSDGQTLSLGDRTISFIHTPWVHWPETMCSYLHEEKILFSCDFFGSHVATSDLFVADEGHVYEAAKRYYAEIMMPFRPQIRKNIEKIEAHPIKFIAPSHGPVYPKPEFIIDAYKDWISETPKNLVVIPYISMHGSTKRMVEYLVAGLAERGVSVIQFELTNADIGKLAINLVDAATIVVGTPTVHVSPHPAVFYATHLANALRPKVRFASIVGSYGWSSKAVEKITELIPNLKVDIIDPVLCKGAPRVADFKALDRLADSIKEKHRSLGLL